jgi:RsiW-degrading membrane proteinase PrsW (M82 family)
MAESLDPVLVVCGVGVCVAALPVTTIATFSLIRQRRPLRSPSVWEIPSELAGGFLILGLAQLLVSVAILAEQLGARGLGWSALLAALALGVVGCYRIIRFRRSRLDERQRENADGWGRE